MADVAKSPLGVPTALTVSWRAAAHRERSTATLAVATVATGFLLAATAMDPAPRLLWNVSASVAPGLYRVEPGAVPRPGAFAVARLRGAARELAARRGYLPLGVPLIKPVVAASGSQICAAGSSVVVASRVIQRRSADKAGRPLPRWEGCRRLARGQLFLVAAGAPDSFDGRYFGVTEARDVIGTAHRIAWP